jgi:transposase
MQVTTIGLDLAKNVFQVHGITEDEEVVFNRPLRRAQLLPFFSKLEPSLIGMEACSSAHHWARELTALGHDVRLIPPMYVKPYVKRGKSDAIDAEAICEAVTRPTMRFVAIKTVEQQALLSLHRARALLVRQRTQLINGLRGMVTEFGVYIAKGLARVIVFADDILVGEVLDLPEIANEVIHNLCEHLMALHARIRWYEDRLKQVAKEDARVRLLRTIPGVGVVTASAIIASIGDGHQFSNGREFAAWLGLTPANKSSGGKEKLARITTLSGHCYAISCRAVDGRSILTMLARRRHDITCPTDQVAP